MRFDVAWPFPLLCKRMFRTFRQHLIVVTSLLAMLLIQVTASSVFVRCENLEGRVVIELSCDGESGPCNPSATSDDSGAPTIASAPCIDTAFRPDVLARGIGAQRDRDLAGALLLPVIDLFATFDPGFSPGLQRAYKSDSSRLVSSSTPDLLRSVVILI